MVVTCFVEIAGQSFPGTFIGEHPGDIYEVQMAGINGYNFVITSMDQPGQIQFPKRGTALPFTRLIGRTPATFTVKLQR